MKKGILIAVTAVASLAVGIGGTYYYMNSNNSSTTAKVSSKTNKEENKKTTSLVNLDVYSDLVNNNLNKLMDYYNDCVDTSGTYLKSQKISNNDIDNSIAYRIVAKKLDANKNAISEADWNKEIENLFGQDYKYNQTSFNTSEFCTSHVYNQSTKQYDLREPECGCTSGPNNFTKIYITKAELQGDTMSIYLKALFPDRSFSKNSEGYVKYYSDPERTKEINLDFEFGDEKDFLEPMYSVKNVLKGGSFKITMKKYDNDNYYFVSSEPIN